MRHSRIVVYGTSAEAQAILKLLSPDILCRILYTIDTASANQTDILSIPIRSEPDDTDNQDCIVLLDYLNSLLAKHILFRNAFCPVINIYENSCFYDGHTLISSQWQSAPQSDNEQV